MTHFRDGQRVLVSAYGDDDTSIVPPIMGTVRRLRRNDNGAWIELDERRADIEFPFPADDSRRRNVLAYPDRCTAVSGGPNR